MFFHKPLDCKSDNCSKYYSIIIQCKLLIFHQIEHTHTTKHLKVMVNLVFGSKGGFEKIQFRYGRNPSHLNT